MPANLPLDLTAIGQPVLGVQDSAARALDTKHMARGRLQ
jgi:hypothetical protein